MNGRRLKNLCLIIGVTFFLPLIVLGAGQKNKKAAPGTKAAVVGGRLVEPGPQRSEAPGLLHRRQARAAGRLADDYIRRAAGGMAQRTDPLHSGTHIPGLDAGAASQDQAFR